MCWDELVLMHTRTPTHACTRTRTRSLSHAHARISLTSFTSLLATYLSHPAPLTAHFSHLMTGVHSYPITRSPSDHAMPVMDDDDDKAVRLSLSL